MPTEINNVEAIAIMNCCKQEILSLRAAIDRLKPKADAYDSLAAVLRLLPQPSVGRGEDVVWTLDRRIRELTPPAAPTPAESLGSAPKDSGGQKQ